MERYLWYFERFNNHERSSRLCAKLKPKLENVCAAMVETMNFPYSEVQFLVEACDAVYEGKETLKWTYAYGYYRESDMDAGMKNLFK